MNKTSTDSETGPDVAPSVGDDPIAIGASTQEDDLAADAPQGVPTLDDSVQQPVGDQGGQRLHRATLWVPCVEALMGFTVPMFFAIFFVPFPLLVPVVVVFIVISTAHHVLRYFTFLYRLTSSELVLQSGVVHRRERRIPFDRVQETRIHQGLLHRLLDLARLEVTTAGSDEKEASLDVLSRHTAEWIKATIGEPDAASERTESGQLDHVCRLSSRDLVLGGLTSKLVASIGAVITLILYFQLFLGVGGTWISKMEADSKAKLENRIPVKSPEQWLDIEARVPDLGPLNIAVDFYLDETFVKGLSLALLGLIGSVIAYVIRYHGFRLTRQGNLLSTSYGWLTMHRGSFSRDRVQALKVEEGLLRRWAGLVSIRVDSAGDRQEIDEARKRDVLVPVVTKMAACELASQVIPGLNDLDPVWRRISRLAVLRGSKKGWLLVALAVIQTYVIAGWFCLVWLPAFPLVFFLNDRWYRNTGYFLGDEHFLSRKGWLNRSTMCLPIKNIQNVTVTQSYFDRRLDLASLSIDTAGQSNTGGGPVIRHLPVDDAKSIQRALALHAGSCEFTW